MAKRWIPAAAVVVLLCNAGTSSAQVLLAVPFGLGNPVFGNAFGANPFGNYVGYYRPWIGSMGAYPGGYGGFMPGPVSTGVWENSTQYRAPTTSYWAYAGRGSSGTSPVSYVSYTLPDRPARVDVLLPADAELWFEGQRTSQTGSDRVFHTPPLEKGRGYHYDVRARWTEDGKTIEQSQSVPVSAGARARVVFPKPRS
jgi:uncharacterized protein (TIGR03000 family)